MPADKAVAYGLWLNQKGKVLADSFALKRGQNLWWLVSIESPAQVIRERLESYIIADDVAIEDITNDWRGIVLGGEGANAWLAEQVGTLPTGATYAEVRNGVIFQGRRGTEASWEWLLNAADADLGMQALKKSGAKELDHVAMERLRIQAGLPAIPRELGAQDLPNEAGLEATAISYTKGCYLGQEVMARLKSMGQVRRRLLSVSGEGVLPVELPAPLFAGGKKIGELRSAVGDGNGFIGMAMLNIMGLDRVAGLAWTADGPPLVRIWEEKS